MTATQVDRPSDVMIVSEIAALMADRSTSGLLLSEAEIEHAAIWKAQYGIKQLLKANHGKDNGFADDRTFASDPHFAARLVWVMWMANKKIINLSDDLSESA